MLREVHVLGGRHHPCYGALYRYFEETGLALGELDGVLETIMGR